MCRAITYLGKQTKMYPFTHLSHNALINQAVKPLYMSHGFNLTGNGFITWNHHASKLLDPIIYKSKLLPAYDYVYDMQSKMIDTDCFISHIRGGALSPGVSLTTTNAHPFYYEEAPFALAHNGGLHLGNLQQQQKITQAMIKETDPKWFTKIRGTTDSEHIYALLLTCFEKKQHLPIEESLPNAIIQTFAIIRDIRKWAKVYYASPVNLFIANGEFICAVRYTFDFGVFDARLTEKHFYYYSLWFTYGDYFSYSQEGYRMKPGIRNSICIASEPLSKDATTWLEVPEYTILLAKRHRPIQLILKDIDL